MLLPGATAMSESSMHDLRAKAAPISDCSPPRMIAGFVLLFIAWAACFPRPLQADEFKKLADNLYIYIAAADGNAVSNSGVVILEHSVLVFDSHFTPEAGQALAEKIAAVTSKPVRYLVNSHFHPDHTHGNQAFPKARQIIASASARRDILQKDLPAMNRMLAAAQGQIEKLKKDLLKPESPAQKEELRRQISAREAFLARMSRQKIVPPAVVVEDSLTIKDGLSEVRLIVPGKGHTEGDLILLIPAEKTVLTGDLFFNAALPNVQDAVILDWMKTLGEVLKLEADRFIPGHGTPGSRHDVEAFLGYFEDLKSIAESAIGRGEPMEQVVRDAKIPSKYAGHLFPNFYPANIQKMYAELKAIQLATDSVPDTDGAKKNGPENPVP
jgi:cyclase